MRTFVLLIATLFLAQSSLAQIALEGTTPAQWRIVWLNDPAHRALLEWNTGEEGETHFARIRQRGMEQASFREIPAVTTGRYSYSSKTSDPETVGRLFYHYVDATDLMAETEYEFELVSDGQSSRRLYFKTAPSEDRPFSLLFGGDSRSDPTARQAINRMLAQLVADGAASDDPADEVLALMHGGDFVATGTDLEQWSRWMSDHELTVGEDGRMLPIIPARGNHDRGRLFCETFGFSPRDQYNWYAQSIGRQLRIVTLNTEASIAGDQAQWLSEELESARPTHRWVIAQYHRPAFPAVKWPSGALVHWVPRFEKYDVDLVCEADGHTIKRTVPIRKSREAKYGVVYIGEGGLGVPPRTPKSNRWYLQSPGMTDKGHHVQRLKFAADQMTYECILLNGEICDRWSQQPRELQRARRSGTVPK